MKTKLADDYLNLKAQIAALAEAETKLKNKLLALNHTEFEGNLGRVTISEIPGRITFDTELLVKHIPAATLELCKKQGKSSLRFNVTSRKVTAQTRFAA